MFIPKLTLKNYLKIKHEFQKFTEIFSVQLDIVGTKVEYKLYKKYVIRIDELVFIHVSSVFNIITQTFI